MTKEERTVRVRCTNCGRGYRNHRILYEQKKSFGDPDRGWEYDEHHQLIQCMGCDTVKYYRFSIREEFNPPTHRSEPYDIHVYPQDDLDTEKRAVMDFGEEVDRKGQPLVPEDVWKMYKETIDCFNAKARTLAGGGLRATVEAICLHQGITQGDLQSKIDELAKRSLLTTSQAKLLHEERYIGNAALHEMSTPTAQDLEDGLGIVEGLINTIYVLPSKAERLRKRRESRGKKKRPAKKKKAGSG